MKTFFALAALFCFGIAQAQAPLRHFVNSAHDQTGFAVQGIGDLDGDGLKDAMVLSNSANLDIYSATGSFIRAHTGYYLWQLSSIADVDGDGIDDYLISHGHLSFQPSSVRLYSGASGGQILSVIESDPSEEFGASIAGSADLNGDGVPDFFAGAPEATDTANGITSAGRVTAYSGADASSLWTVYGSSISENLGRRVERLGDINADGVEDVLCSGDVEAFVLDGTSGAILHSVPATSQVDLSPLSDVDGDGVVDFVVGDPSSGAGGFALSGELRVYSGATATLIRVIPGSGGSFGSQIDDAGDVDGDGISEILVGAPSQGSGSFGAVHVYSGADGSMVWSYGGSSAAVSRVGYSVTSIGDITGDGRSEVFFGAPGNFSTSPGQAYVFDLSMRNHPGSGDDLFLESSLDLAPMTFHDTKVANPGQLLQLHLDSPNGFLVGSLPLLLADVFPTIGAAGTVPGFPSLHVSLLSMTVLFDGSAAPFGPQLLPTSGLYFAFLVPPFASGTSLMLQGVALSQSTSNGLFAATDAHEIQIP